MMDEARSLEERAERLEKQANSTADTKRRSDLRGLANELRRQAQQKRRPH
jgi:hypothetical protein